MYRFELLLKFPKLYASLALRIRKPNFEKVLYLREIKHDYTVFDLGANIGYFTYLYSKLVGERGCVHAFEPVPLTYKKLCQNTKRCNNLSLNNFAIGEKDEKGIISYDPQDLEVSLTLDNEKALLSFLQDIGYDTFRKVEKGFPAYEANRKNHSSDYFYLHAFSSKVTQNSS
tara:strand:+ start:32 stop:547 length:516 start_codon:yes stop_codon:yes gene_type:complete